MCGYLAQSLNVLAGEGSATVSKTPQGATLKVYSTLSLSLNEAVVILLSTHTHTHTHTGCGVCPSHSLC